MVHDVEARCPVLYSHSVGVLRREEHCEVERKVCRRAGAAAAATAGRRCEEEVADGHLLEVEVGLLGLDDESDDQGDGGDEEGDEGEEE